jgi:hypothetical protein
MPMSVMPIWTVDRKRLGSWASASAGLGTGATLIGHGSQADSSRRNDGQFGKRENAVEKDEDGSDDNLDQ